MAFLKNLLGLFGRKPQASPAPRRTVQAPPVRTTEKPAVEAARKPIRLPSKFDDLIDFGLAEHSSNKHWSVGYRDPGPDASQNRPKGVRLRDNTTGQIVAAVESLQRPFSVAVADTGIFGVNDAGPASELSANLVFFDATGRQVYSRAYKANLAGFSISQCGRYAASQTCNSANEDSFILEIHDVAQQRVLASVTPVAGWSDTYTFETEEGELKRVLAKINNLGKFAYSPTGEFLDAKKLTTARLTKGDPWTRVRAAEELAKADSSEKAFQRAMSVVEATLAGFEPGQDNRWLPGAYRLKGELLERAQRTDEAIEAYRTALELNPKIGVKKKLAELEKAAKHRPLFDQAAAEPASDSPAST